MKKLITLGIAFVFVLTTACDDYIEVEPKGPVAETYFNSAEDYDKALIGAYDLLQATFWGVQTAVIASPDIIAGGDPLNYDQPTLQDVVTVGSLLNPDGVGVVALGQLDDLG